MVDFSAFDRFADIHIVWIGIQECIFRTNTRVMNSHGEQIFTYLTLPSRWSGWKGHWVWWSHSPWALLLKSGWVLMGRGGHNVHFNWTPCFYLVIFSQRSWKVAQTQSDTIETKSLCLTFKSVNFYHPKTPWKRLLVHVYYSGEHILVEREGEEHGTWYSTQFFSGPSFTFFKWIMFSNFSPELVTCKPGMNLMGCS